VKALNTLVDASQWKMTPQKLPEQQIMLGWKVLSKPQAPGNG
jgi:hypothetical protein